MRTFLKNRLRAGLRRQIRRNVAAVTPKAPVPRKGLSLKKKVIIGGAVGAGLFGFGVERGRRWTLGLGQHEKTQKKLDRMSDELLEMQLAPHRKPYKRKEKKFWPF